jgi:hypothetical protein
VSAVKNITKTNVGIDIYIDTSELADVLHCDRSAAIKIGELARAKMIVDGQVSWSVDKVKKYMNRISG